MTSRTGKIHLIEAADAIREKLIELARPVYNNHHRAALKRKINVLFGSEFIEEKSYAAKAEKGHAPSTDPT